MHERYSRLFALESNQYSLGSSVIVQAGALLLDNTTKTVLAQLKIINVSTKQIIAMKIKLTCYDVWGQSIGDDVEFHYMDLKVNRDEAFGQNTPIYLPDETTRSFAIKGITVVFADRSQWSFEFIAWETLNFYISLDGFFENADQLKQFRLETTPQSKYIPTDATDIWLCSCGHINRQDEFKCHNCGVDHKQLSRSLERDYLNTRIEQREKFEQEEKDKIALLHAKKKREKKKILFRWLGVSFGVIVFLSTFSVLFFNFIKPEIKYRKAIRELELDNYATAYSIFQEIAEYKDAESLALEAMRNTELTIENNRWELSDYEYEGQVFYAPYVCEVTSGRKDPLLIYVNYMMDTEAWSHDGHTIVKDNILTLSNGKGVIREQIVIGHEEITSPLSVQGYLPLNKLNSKNSEVTIEKITTTKDDPDPVFGMNVFHIDAKVRTSDRTGNQILAYEVVDKNIGVVLTAYCFIANGTADIHERFALSKTVPKPDYEIVPVAIYSFSEAQKDGFSYSSSALAGEINVIGSFEGSIRIESPNNPIGLAVFRLEIYDGTTIVNTDGLIKIVLINEGLGNIDVYISDREDTDLDYKIDLIGYAPFTAIDRGNE